MAIPPELEAQILRYYHVEKWRAGTIARHLGVHHGSVERVLAQAGLPSIRAVQRPSQIDVYLPSAGASRAAGSERTLSKT